MRTKIISLLLVLGLISCDPQDLQRVLDSVNQAPLTDIDISNGLKEALQFGVDNSVNYLSTQDGFYKSIYKIVLPEEANVVIDKLSIIPGFDNLEEELIRRINRAAEDAASKAGPIFIDAVRGITFDDAMNILMGEKNAATQYLHNRTYSQLYDTFKPVLIESLNKFNALDYWADAVNTYNKLPFVSDVNPDLADHINQKALYGLFDLIEEKELGIREDISQRTTSLLQKVFAKQD
ncbi:MAG: DUF4197 domain-containing protein [Saprospiraceae bacterium]|nr:DUF4197 domain-containing protein [Saprospiraceae bacterium]